MGHELAPLIERIRELLDPRAADPGKPLLTVMEHTLTDGYARALAIEGDRMRLERRIADLTRQIDRLEQLAELRTLAERLRSTDDDLVNLRHLLGDLQREVDAARTAA